MEQSHVCLPLPEPWRPNMDIALVRKRKEGSSSFSHLLFTAIFSLFFTNIHTHSFCFSSRTLRHERNMKLRSSEAERGEWKNENLRKSLWQAVAHTIHKVSTVCVNAFLFFCYGIVYNFREREEGRRFVWQRVNSRNSMEFNLANRSLIRKWISFFDRRIRRQLNNLWGFLRYKMSCVARNAKIYIHSYVHRHENLCVCFSYVFFVQALWISKWREIDERKPFPSCFSLFVRSFFLLAVLFVI